MRNFLCSNAPSDLTAIVFSQHAPVIAENLRLLENEMQIQSELRDLLIGFVIEQVQLSDMRHRVDLLPQLLHSAFRILEILLDYFTWGTSNLQFFKNSWSSEAKTSSKITFLPINLNLISILSLFLLEVALFLLDSGFSLVTRLSPLIIIILSFPKDRMRLK